MPAVVLQHELLGHLGDARARSRWRGRRTGGRRAPRRAPGRPARSPLGPRPPRRPRRSVPTDSFATRRRSSSERTARRRLRSSVACSNSSAAAAARMRASRSRSIAREAAREEVDHAVDALAVVLPGDVADAGRLAALDVVVEARAAAAPPRLRTRAGAEHEHLREHLERRAHALGVGVRAEVGASGAVALAGEVHARIVLVERDRDERIGLVVAQADVEARPVLLDEALLGQQRLGLGGHDDAFDVLDAGDHLRVAGAARHLGLGEVRGDPLAHRLGLADVDHAPASVAEQVHARLVGQAATLLGEARLCASAVCRAASVAAIPSRIGGAVGPPSARALSSCASGGRPRAARRRRTPRAANQASSPTPVCHMRTRAAQHEHPEREAAVQERPMAVAEAVDRDAVFAVEAQPEVAEADAEGHPQRALRTCSPRGRRRAGNGLPRRSPRRSPRCARSASRSCGSLGRRGRSRAPMSVDQRLQARVGVLDRAPGGRVTRLGLGRLVAGRPGRRVGELVLELAHRGLGLLDGLLGPAPAR